MAFLRLFCLLTIATVEVMVVTGETGSQVSRQKRSDDRDPLEAVVEHLSQQVTSLNAQLTSVNAKVATLETKQNTLDKTVAFYIWNNANPLQALAHDILIFSHVATNIGNGYEKDSGIFTAPLSGLYDFQATIMGIRESTQTSVHAAIYVDGHIVSWGISTFPSAGEYDQTSMRAIVHVTAGSKVAVKNIDNRVSDFYSRADYQATTFSGFLIKAD